MGTGLGLSISHGIVHKHNRDYLGRERTREGHPVHRSSALKTGGGGRSAHWLSQHHGCAKKSQREEKYCGPGRMILYGIDHTKAHPLPGACARGDLPCTTRR